MNDSTLIVVLGQEKKEQIEVRARSYIHGSRVDWNGFNHYLQTLAGGTSMKVIEENTGDFLDNVFLLIPEVVCANNAFFEKYETVKSGKGIDNRGHFFMVERKKAEELNKDLSLNEREKIILLQRQQFNKYKNFDTKRTFTTEELCGVWNIKIDACNTVRSKLIKHNVLDKVSVGKHKYVYQLTDKYCYMGKTKSNDFSRIYFNKFNEIIDEVQMIERKIKKKKDIRSSALGTFQAIIPYFHKETNHLSKNPSDSILKTKKDKDENGNIVLENETVFEAYEREVASAPRKRVIKYMTYTALYKLTGIHPDTLEEHLEILQQADALYVKKNKGTIRCVAHPYLLLSYDFSKDDEYFRKLCMDFGEHIPTEQEKRELSK